MSHVEKAIRLPRRRCHCIEIHTQKYRAGTCRNGRASYRWAECAKRSVGVDVVIFQRISRRRNAQVIISSIRRYAVNERKNARSRCQSPKRIEIHVTSRSNCSFEAQELSPEIICRTGRIIGFGLARAGACLYRECSAGESKSGYVVIYKDEYLLTGCERQTHQLFRCVARHAVRRGESRPGYIITGYVHRRSGRCRRATCRSIHHEIARGGIACHFE